MKESSKENLNIVLVQDAVEQTRQPKADVFEFFEGAIKKVCGAKRAFNIKNVSGNSAKRALNSLEAGNVDLLVFASNAMIRRDGEIFICFEQNSERIKKFVYRGGSIIIFHQGFSGHESDVKSLEFVGAKNYVGRNKIKEIKGGLNSFSNCHVFNLDHILLSYPNLIDVNSLSENENGLTPLGVPQGYFTIEPFSKNGLLEPAAQLVDGYYTLASFEATGRVVFSAYPADWAKDKNLVENIISYGLFGKPEAVLMRSSRVHENLDDYWEMMRIRLNNSFNLGELNKSLEKGSADNFDYLSSSDSYMLKHARVALLDSSLTPRQAEKSFVIQEILQSGGCVVSADLLDEKYGKLDGVEYFSGFIGAGRNPSFSKNLHEIISSMTSSGWFKNALIHDLRDVILGINLIRGACDFFKDSQSARDHVTRRVESWFDNSDATLDPGTALTAAWVSAAVNPETGISPT